MKRFCFEIGLATATVICAVLAWSSTHPLGAAEELPGQVERPQNKANSGNRFLAGEVAVEVNCPVGHGVTGEIKFPREFPKAPAVFLTETNQAGAFIVFKADGVSTKGIKWAGLKLTGPEKYKTRLSWLAVLPD
jgi:hypothetical protein